MIAFATVFLGLVLGVQPVAVVTRGDVAAVELVLDGRPVRRLAGFGLGIRSFGRSNTCTQST